MVGLPALWMPMVVSAVFVFIALSILHMMPGWHKHADPHARWPDLRAGDGGDLRVAVAQVRRENNEQRTEPRFSSHSSLSVG
jgi:hypothetical protein